MVKTSARILIPALTLLMADLTMFCMDVTDGSIDHEHIFANRIMDIGTEGLPDYTILNEHGGDYGEVRRQWTTMSTASGLGTLGGAFVTLSVLKWR